MDFEVKSILEQMTLEEKISMLSGHNNFYIQGVERLNIPPVKMADGPMGLQNNRESTAFPASIGLAASWDKTLSRQVGEAIGQQCRAKGIGVLLAPGVNIYKYHQNGRNFEYMGEDPILAAKLVVPFIKGVQAQKVVATVKHFVCNNQDYERHQVSSNVDEKTLNEIYFPPFKAAIQEAGVKAVMISYNPINNVQASENSYLISEVLRKQWGFEGIVMSDWVSVYSTKCFKAGLDLEMPKAQFMTSENIHEMLNSDEITVEDIDKKVQRVLTVCQEMNLYEQEKQEIDFTAHRKIAYDIAIGSIVLLKNEQDILPLPQEQKITVALVGNKCIQLPASGGGAALVKEFSDRSLLECFNELENIQCSYFEYANEVELNAFDYVIAAVGFTKDEEGEAIDRSFSLAEEDYTTLDKISAQNSNLITLIFAGGGVELDSRLAKSSALLHCWYPGEAGGEAICNILVGKHNPSGKLPFSWEKSIHNSPGQAGYDEMINQIEPTGKYNIQGKPHENYQLDYKEGVHFGNRYFIEEDLQFPFGYGLSYSKFIINKLDLNKRSYQKNEIIELSCELQNISDITGKEVIQLYIRNLNDSDRDFWELKDFEKIELKAGERKLLKFKLPISALASYQDKNWSVAAGNYEIRINDKALIISVGNEIV